MSSIPYIPMKGIEPTDRIPFNVDERSSLILKEIAKKNPDLDRPGLIRKALETTSRRHGDKPEQSKDEMLKMLLSKVAENSEKIERILNILERDEQST